MSDATLAAGIDSDEWYPVYFIVTAGTRCSLEPHVTIPSELTDRARAAFAEFEEVQAALKAIVDECAARRKALA